MRDLVAVGFDIERVALSIENECRRVLVTAHVNVLEVLAPEATQLDVERLLDEKRRTGPCELRIRPVADLVCTVEEFRALQASLAGDVPIGDEPALAGLEACAAADGEPEPASPFEIDSLVEVIRQTIGDGVATIAGPQPGGARRAGGPRPRRPVPGRLAVERGG